MAKRKAAIRPLSVPALQLRQGDTTLYLTRFTAGDLANGHTRPDAWTPANRGGYQREPQPTRFKKIADYISGREAARPLLPQAIVLSARSKLRFTNASDGVGKLIVPVESLPLFEVDGQHRIGGIRRALQERPDLAGYSFPVVIVEDMARLDEAVVFFVMNTRQQRVQTDLAQRLITEQAKDPALRERLVTEGKIWIERATRVVDLLNDAPDHPWAGRIGVPGIRQRGTILRQVSFIQSLKPILASDSGIYATAPPDVVAKLLVAYWQATEDAFGAAFKEPAAYVIQKTVGVFPLHAIAPLVFEQARRKQERITREHMREVLVQLAKDLRNRYHPGEDTSFFWRREEGEAGKYAGAKGFKIITEVLRDHLPQRGVLVVG